MEILDQVSVRRLALARAGLLKPEWTGLPRPAARVSWREAALKVIDRFGYLQLDTVSIAGARSHALVLLSRLDGFKPERAESLLQPSAPLFEYWGHEASWMPLDLYPAFEFRRERFRVHPWWGDVLSGNRKEAAELLAQIKTNGGMQSKDFEGPGSRGWWDLKLKKKIATALWSAGEIAISERKNFLRTYDLTERVIPDEVLARPRLAFAEALDILLLKALDGHGWATSGTLANTWRLRNCRKEVSASLERLREANVIAKCDLALPDGKTIAGWLRNTDFELAARLARLCPDNERSVLLSPFDPVLWDRTRVLQLFGFEQVLEIFKPKAQRMYGYYCMPVLCGEHLVARVDMKAERAASKLNVLSSMAEKPTRAGLSKAGAKRATEFAIRRHAAALDLKY